MLISHNWLKKYIPSLDDISKIKIAESFSTKLAEVERIIPIRQELKGIISAEIVDTLKIEESKKLTKCKVKISENEQIDVICGAPNVKKGMKVALCRSGGRIYDPGNNRPVEIGSKSMYGVTSNGMIASEKELGISDDHEGIMELDNEIPIGTDLSSLLQDHIYEIENKSLGHRPDCFSHEGLARELSAILNLEFIKESDPQPLIPTNNLPLEVIIKANEGECIRFTTIILSDIKVKRSPLWLKSILNAVGIRSVNNIVDAANYIMLDKGQPLHTYDYDKIDSKKLIIRMGKNNEIIKAIDGKEYKLSENMLVISNGKEIDDIAGIMGGKSSEITNDTKNIIIEAANFNMYSIRRTSRALGLRSEASMRFEKGQDPEKVERAIKEAVELILDLSAGEIASELNDQYILKYEPTKIELDLTLVKRFLGIELSVREILEYLEKLQCSIEDKEKILNITGLPEQNMPITVSIPSFRNDLKIEQDLLEEIARLYGYNKLVPTLPSKDIGSVIPNKGLKINRRISDILSSLGIDEIYTYSFIGEDLYSKLGLNIKNCLKIVNPLSPELSYLRNSLIPSLIEKVNMNKKDFSYINIYEIGRVVFKGIEEENNLHDQPIHLGIVHYDDQNENPFYNLSGVIDSLSKELVCELHIENLNNSFDHLHPLIHKGRAGVIKNNEQDVGIIAEVHPKILNDMDIKGRVAFIEINISKLSPNIEFKKEYRPISQYQSIKRDISFFINRSTEYASVVKVIKGVDNKYLKNIELIDVFEPQEDRDKKSITVSLTLQSDEKTLTDDEINLVIDKLMVALEKELRATVRKNLT